jgi:hypothetical protein
VGQPEVGEMTEEREMGWSDDCAEAAQPAEAAGN